MPLEVLRDLWVVRFGEDCEWNVTYEQAEVDHYVNDWYEALTNAGLLQSRRVGSSKYRIRIKKDT